MKGIVREFKNVEAADKLTVTFTPKTGVPTLCGLEIIRE
jgi:hypothetical protein